MKVRDLMKKINGKTAKLPVYLQNGWMHPDTRREAISWDFAGYYSDEADRTVTGIELDPLGVIIYYR